MIQRNYEQEQLADAAERQHALEREARKQAHELKIAELKHKHKPRVDGWTKIGLAIIKAPVYPLVVLCITILTLRGRPVPQVLEDLLR